MRHAYLIIAHHQADLLRTALRLLDDERNDIFIHVDERSTGLDEADLAGSVQRAGLFFTERTRVNWGGYSMINAEMLLLRAAVERGGYSYVHLLSGVDLPLKTQEEIHLFFERHDGTEFVHFADDLDISYRVKYYYPFQELRGRGTSRWLDRLQRLGVALQDRAGIDRIGPSGPAPRFGACWFSITGGLAQYLVDRAPEIRRTYRMSVCCDEIFLQTMVADSPFAGAVHQGGESGPQSGALRHIDWSRGDPYTFRSSDYEELIGSPRLFARKFDMDLDAGIVRRVSAFVAGGGAVQLGGRAREEGGTTSRSGGSLR
jgi:hypothetical protein